MPDAFIPAVIRESAPMHATRLDLVSATSRSQGLAEATAKEHRADAFAAADDLLRALKRIQALPTNRQKDMRNWLCDTASGALDQLRNVEGCINKELDENGCEPVEPLDLSELEAFWRSVDDPTQKGEGR